jgi:hypothetical protein
MISIPSAIGGCIAGWLRSRVGKPEGTAEIKKIGGTEVPPSEQELPKKKLFELLHHGRELQLCLSQGLYNQAFGIFRG